jgi:uncharacterized protein Smg (DUF494 family)
MTAKLVEILAKILDALRNNYTLEEVNKKLLKEKNVNKQIVSAAFSWIYDKKLNLKDRTVDKLKKKNFRFLNQDEIDILGMENYNYIIHLMNVGLLNASELDSILEQILLYPGERISKEEINWIILFSLVDFQEDILPGSRFLLYSSDTIN